jgi:hypothetical protein
LELGGKAFRGGLEVAAQEEVVDFGPVDFGEIQAKGDPAAGADIGGEVVALGLGVG